MPAVRGLCKAAFAPGRGETRVKDVQGPQLPIGAWPGAPYKGCETTMAAI